MLAHQEEAWDVAGMLGLDVEPIAWMLSPSRQSEVICDFNRHGMGTLKTVGW